MDKQYCEICDREAVYVCGDCHIAGYCSHEHRMEHWRTAHKDQCKVLQNIEEIKNQKEVESNRMTLRKQYFQTFSNKIYDQALKIARQLLKFQKANIKVTRFIQNQFQYGITVCLLCRTLIILGKNDEAKIEITEYLKQKQHFLQDMRDICKFTGTSQGQEGGQATNLIKQKSNSPKKYKQQTKSVYIAVTDKSKQFLGKKVELISAVANIFHSLSLPPIDYYTMYLSHIEFAFGPESLQASNCFFLMGTYFMEQHQFNRSIACLFRAAEIRGPKGGDCFYNLAIIYEMRSKFQTAIKMFQQAIKLFEEEQGESSLEVAKIYQQIAQIMIRKNDLNGAVRSLEKALKIYANKSETKEIDVIKEKIKMLHDFIKQKLQSKDKSLLPKQIQDHLVDKIIKEAKINEPKAEQLSFAQQTKRNKDRFMIQNLLKLSENFLSRLNPLQIYRLSQLQLELQKCSSQFAVAYVVSNSDFMKRLGQNRLKQMRLQNEKLFQLMNIERKMDISINQRKN